MSRHAFADSPRLAELLARYHLGLIPPKASARLAAIFEADPPDALARLERACDHLGVTGERADELVAEAAARGPGPRQGAGVPPTSSTRTAPRTMPAEPPRASTSDAVGTPITPVEATNGRR